MSMNLYQRKPWLQISIVQLTFYNIALGGQKKNIFFLITRLIITDNEVFPSKPNKFSLTSD